MSEHAYPEGLKVFTCEHEEWVIAADAADAGEVYREHAGDTIQEQTGVDSLEWVEEDPSKMFGLHDEDSGVSERKTFAEWARHHGKRGYFASGNY